MKKKITITKNTKNFAWHLTEIKNPQTFNITSNIPEVKIYYDNFFVGFLPYQDKVIRKKNYRFTFKKKNYQQKNMVISFLSPKSRNLDIRLAPFKRSTYQLQLSDLPKDTIVNLSQNQKSIYQGPYKGLNLAKGKYSLTLTHPGYLTRRKKITLMKDEYLNITLIKNPPKHLKLVRQKKLARKEFFIFSNLEYNAKYFFMNDNTDQKKLIFDNDLNFIEEVEFPYHKHLLNPILDRNIFFSEGGFSFKKTLLLQGTLHRYLNEQEKKFKDIVFINRSADKLLVVDRGYPVIFVYQYLGGWKLIDEINALTIKSFKKNLLKTPYWGQAFFLTPERIIFLEKKNQQIISYDLNKKKFFFFTKNLENNPILPEEIFLLRVFGFCESKEP